MAFSFACHQVPFPLHFPYHWQVSRFRREGQSFYDLVRFPLLVAIKLFFRGFYELIYVRYLHGLVTIHHVWVCGSLEGLESIV